MTAFHLAGFDLIPRVLGAGAWLAAGAAIGAMHFLTLRWNVRLFAVGQPLPLAFAAQLVRLAIVACALGVIASQFGALALLMAAAGILGARMAVIRLGVPS